MKQLAMQTRPVEVDTTVERLVYYVEVDTTGRLVVYHLTPVVDHQSTSLYWCSTT